MSKPEIVVMDLESVRLKRVAVQMEIEQVRAQIARLMEKQERLSALADDLHWLEHRKEQR